MEQVPKEYTQKVPDRKRRMPSLALGSTHENLTVPVTMGKDICIFLEISLKYAVRQLAQRRAKDRREARKEAVNFPNRALSVEGTDAVSN